MPQKLMMITETDDDHFAHFAQEQRCFYCHVRCCCLCINKLSSYGSMDAGLLIQRHVQLNN